MSHAASRAVFRTLSDNGRRHGSRRGGGVLLLLHDFFYNLLGAVLAYTHMSFSIASLLFGLLSLLIVLCGKVQDVWNHGDL